MDQKKPVIIVLAGFSCAGKSTIAKRLADLYNFDLMAQHIIYHDIAASKGYRRARHYLAAVGPKEFVKETTVETVRRVKALGRSKGVIIDASYGPLSCQILQQEFSETQIITIAVSVNGNMRLGRMMERMGTSRIKAEQELIFRDGFLKAVGLEQIMELADFSISNSEGIKLVVAEIAKKLCQYKIRSKSSGAS